MLYKNGYNAQVVIDRQHLAGVHGFTVPSFMFWFWIILIFLDRSVKYWNAGIFEICCVRLMIRTEVSILHRYALFSSFVRSLRSLCNLNWALNLLWFGVVCILRTLYASCLKEMQFHDFSFLYKKINQIYSYFISNISCTEYP